MLTKIQDKVLKFIKLQIASNGYPPTIKEISEYFGWKSRNGAVCHLVALEKKKKIKRSRCARTIQVLED